MLISDYFFLIYFLPVFLISYFLVHRNPWWSNLFLIAASVLYYATFNVSHLSILILPLFMDYVVALMIQRTNSQKNKKILLGLAVVFNLCLLGYYKYFFFGITTLRQIVDRPFLFPSITAFVMPVGISFITFQRLSYLIDTYRGKIQPTRNIIEYFVYGAFFPQLLAGPIVRFSQIKDQLPSRKIDFNLIFSAITYLSLGLASKILIADQLFRLENRLTEQLTQLNIMSATVLIVYFTFRLYFPGQF